MVKRLVVCGVFATALLASGCVSAGNHAQESAGAVQTIYVRLDCSAADAEIAAGDRVKFRHEHQRDKDYEIQIDQKSDNPGAAVFPTERPNVGCYGGPMKQIKVPKGDVDNETKCGIQGNDMDYWRYKVTILKADGSGELCHSDPEICIARCPAN